MRERDELQLRTIGAGPVAFVFYQPSDDSGQVGTIGVADVFESSMTLSKVSEVALLLCCLAALLTPACSRSCQAPAERPNQRSPLASPSGRFVAHVPVLEVENRDFRSYRTPRITDADGLVLLEDYEGFPAWFSVYWMWDSADRLWLYNSDDGAIWVYEVAGGSGAFFRHRAEGDPPEGLIPL